MNVPCAPDPAMDLLFDASGAREKTRAKQIKKETRKLSDRSGANNAMNSHIRGISK